MWTEFRKAAAEGTEPLKTAFKHRKTEESFI